MCPKLKSLWNQLSFRKRKKRYSNNDRTRLVSVHDWLLVLASMFPNWGSLLLFWLAFFWHYTRCTFIYMSWINRYENLTKYRITLQAFREVSSNRKLVLPVNVCDVPQLALYYHKMRRLVQFFLQPNNNCRCLFFKILTQINYTFIIVVSYV